MKLYVYDHCLFCVRARMILGLKNLPAELIILANDDEATPISLVGKKMVPILIKNDGTAMPESLDIVRYIDENFGKQILSEQVRSDLENWIQRVSGYYKHLVSPRFVKIGLEEFSTQSAVDYFIKKKTETVGDFAENIANSAQYIEEINKDLIALSPLIKADDKANGEQLSIEDILLFPILRNLTCVKGVIYPNNVEHYMKKMAELAKIAFYTDRAI
ncbi:glutaredoxin [[Actinobacillus] rossii]|uniref:Glutaredoxin n=1 Tax=[Actinobacillus] rossii TaxID=123820 RepID=A0A380TYF6_9PAST|nr:glutaredoxin [[Actinobacillus] rossii]